MSSMEVYYLISGEKPNGEGGFELLSSNLADEVAESLTPYTDLDDKPDNRNFEPFIRGFRKGDYYLIVKSFPDSRDGVRKGRTFSHSIVTHIEHLERIDFLNELFDLLPDEYDPESYLEDEETSSFAPSIDEEKNLGSKSSRLLSRYITAAFDQIPAYLTQPLDYLESVNELWRILPLNEREKFSFRMGFNPSSGTLEPNTVIYLESEYKDRWEGHVKEFDRELDSEVLDYFLGRRKTKIDQFLADFEFPEPDIQSLNDILVLSRHYDGLSRKEFPYVKVVADYVLTNSPSSESGAIGKTNLVKKVEKLIPEFSSKRINSIRNWNIGAFPNSETITQAVYGWAKEKIFEEDSAKTFSSWGKDEGLDWWQESISKAIGEWEAKWEEMISNRIWIWLSKGFIAQSALFKLIELSDGLDYHLAKAEINFKEISTEVIGEIIEFCENECHPFVHANLIPQKHGLSEAFSAHLKISRDIESIRFLVDHYPSKEILEYSVKVKISEVHQIAGEVLEKHPDLLKGFDQSEKGWWKIWDEAIRAGMPVLGKHPDPMVFFHEILDFLIENGKGAVPSNILFALSKSKVSGLLDYPKREVIWDQLEDNVKDNFEIATVSQIIANGNLKEQLSELETPLKTSLLSHRYLLSKRFSLDSRIEIAGLLSLKREDLFLRFLNSINRVELGTKQSYLIGKKIKELSWEKAAKLVLPISKYNTTFQSARKECFSVLSGWDQFWSYPGETKVSPEEWWKEFIDFCIKLLPDGPNEDGIWVRAGLNDSDLLNKGNGKELWADALSKFKNGKYRLTDLKNLLSTIKKDNPNNREIEFFITTLDQLEK